MPINNINYLNTIIYKICSKDITIKDIYVGSTTNFISRKREHKKNCNKETSKEYNNYKYKFIRDNGGWDNWEMILVEKYPCNSNLEARKREKEICEQLTATLNKQSPYTDQKEYSKKYYEEKKYKKTPYYNTKILCECGFTSCIRTYKRHLKNKLHQKNMILKNNS